MPSFTSSFTKRTREPLAPPPASSSATTRRTTSSTTSSVRAASGAPAAKTSRLGGVASSGTASGRVGLRGADRQVTQEEPIVTIPWNCVCEECGQNLCDLVKLERQYEKSFAAATEIVVEAKRRMVSDRDLSLMLCRALRLDTAHITDREPGAPSQE